MDQTALIILAGGLGTRVGGVNKALLSLQERPLIQHVINNLAASFNQILISANRDTEILGHFGYPVIPDLDQYTQMGPLAGIVSTAQKLSSSVEYIQIVPCDLPFLTAEIVETLHNRLKQDANLDIVYAADTIHQHPIVCQMRRHHLDAISAQLNSHGKHSLRAIIEPFAHLKVEFNNTYVFTNFNSNTMF